MDYATFFQTATGGKHAPYAWQGRLANGETYVAGNPATHTGTGCQSRLIDIPTGLGKTAGVVLAWLWNRLGNGPVPPPQTSHSTPQPLDHSTTWPRRLIYCLPMRTLVEQTAGEVENWLINLWNARDQFDENATTELAWLCGFDPEKPDTFTNLPSPLLPNPATPPLHDSTTPPLHDLRSPIILMGGEELSEKKRDWDLYPEKPCILIGTQDMLLSRALNRGYGMSRYRWPMHFGLLNNDALWVMDETQLMGVGIETSAQLQGFRQNSGTARSSATWWMSATLDTGQLATADFGKDATDSLQTLALTEEEKKQPAVHQRTNAPKTLQRAPIAPTSDKAADLKNYTDELARFAAHTHQKDKLTLLIVNRVERAQALAQALRSHCPDTPVGLVHSRFRRPDRSSQEAVLHHPGDRIVVATQAVEAGVDVSAKTLITEVAPLSSLVQRFGRCNRYGEQEGGGSIHWIDLQPADEKDARSVPYAYAELREASASLAGRASASPADLRTITWKPENEIRPVIRRKDLIELFDTTPDLSGNDLDVSRYIRDSGSADVHVYWRDFTPDAEFPAEGWTRPSRDETVRVPYGAFAAFVKKQPAYRWNAIDEQWERLRLAPIPGASYLLPMSSGGYRADLGWTGNPKDKLSANECGSSLETAPDAHGRDPGTFTGGWVPLTQHLRDVEATARSIADAFALEPTTDDALSLAAKWHDAGKAHPVFQDMLKAAGEPPDPHTLWAKAERRGGFPDTWRRGFRHELASALAWLGNHPECSALTTDLVAYLIATHHGKIRLSLRSMPGETEPKDPNRLFARGVWDGEELPPVDLPDGQTVGPTKLDLAVMRMGASSGGPSWLSRMLALRDDPALGPFRLAFLETLLRAADGRASKEPEEPAEPSEMAPKQQPA
ncbi:MAG: type I-G CRISPR-associated helicase/endonuclease Cas3g [Opitutales bacterium]